MDEVAKSKWRKMSSEEKLLATYTAVKDESAYCEGMATANFQKFLDALNKCVGGNEVQMQLIEKQLAIALNALSFENVIANEVKKICDINTLMGRSNNPSQEYFWKAYTRCSKKSIEAYKSDMDHRVLQVAMSQLIEYHNVLQRTGADKAEQGKVFKEMLSLLQVQICRILECIDTWTNNPVLYNIQDLCFWDTSANVWLRFNGMKYEPNYPKTNPPKDNAHHWEQCHCGRWKNKYTGKKVVSKHNPVSGQLTWASLSFRDLQIICDSILLASYNKHFCLYLGREKVRMEVFTQTCNNKVQMDVLMQTLQPQAVYHEKSSRRQSYPERNSPQQQQQQQQQEVGEIYIRADGKKVRRVRRATEYDHNYAHGSEYRQHCQTAVTALEQKEQCMAGTYNAKCEFVPTHPDKYKLLVHTEMPARISDPNHWGFLAWQFCAFMDQFDHGMVPTVWTTTE
jgi:hypothetical protein